MPQGACIVYYCCWEHALYIIAGSIHCVIVDRPQKTSKDMYEFADEESEAPATRQIVQGHDR